MDEIFPYIWVLFPFFFVGLWCSVCFILSKIGGWGELANRFRATDVPSGTTLCGQSVQLRGFCNYNGCLTLIIAKEGLYLRIWPMFRLGHHALLIPWNELHNPKPGGFLWIKKITLDAGTPRITKISVSEKAFGMFPERPAR